MPDNQTKRDAPLALIAAAPVGRMRLVHNRPQNLGGDNTVGERLDSWKEIAAHLARTVRTVQRWERLGLPVHRHEHVTGSSVYAFRHELDQWWRTRRPEGPPSATQPVEGSTHKSLEPRIAVLPFTALGAPEDAYFADGFVDELITRLAVAHSIAVISRTSVMQFRERDTLPLDRVATSIAATLLVEGTIHREADQVIISVRLIDPFDAGRVIWGQQYGCTRPDVRQLQAQVAQDIVLHATDRARLRRGVADQPRRVVPEAHDAYLMGRFYLHKRTVAALETALERFAQAVAFDPTDARGYAGLAETYVLLSGNEFWSPSAGFPKAREAALQALARDERNAVAHAALAMVTALYEWRWDEADAGFARALDVNPSYAEAWHWRGAVRLMAGRIAESVGPLTHAVDLDPLAPIIVVNSGRPLHFLGHYDKAVERCDQALSFAPGFWIAHVNRAFAFSAQGDGERALDAARLAVELSKGNSIAVLSAAEAHAVAGNHDTALSIVEQITRPPDEEPSYVSAFRVARVFARLGEKDTAFEWLERSGEERSLGNSTYLPIDPALDSIKGDPRFDCILRALHLR
jgi:TolB-like protein/tetratricopeptide (TPR) repeat protein